MSVKNWIKENGVKGVSLRDEDSQFGTCDAGGNEGLKGEVYECDVLYLDPKEGYQTFTADLSYDAISLIEYGV